MSKYYDIIKKMKPLKKKLEKKVLHKNISDISKTI